MYATICINHSHQIIIIIVIFTLYVSSHDVNDGRMRMHDMVDYLNHDIYGHIFIILMC